jgi:hypothetical protein
LTILISFLFPLFVFSQHRYVTFIKQKPDKKLFNTAAYTINYPFFRFQNEQLSKNVNAAVRKDVFQDREVSDRLPLAKRLKQLADQGLTDLSYEEVRNDEHVLSFTLYFEWLAAYPTGWRTHFVFDKQRGRRITLDSLVLSSKRKAFQALLQSMQEDSMERYRQELKGWLDSKEVDSSDYEYALEQTKNNCWEYYDATNFLLYKDRLEVIINCEFMHALQNLTPSSSLYIPLKEIALYLKPRYRK